MKKKSRKNANFANARGNVYYGMHFYPGIAEYHQNGQKLRVFLNEKTLRKMDATFPGCPVFVHHTDEPLPDDIDQVRDQADGWVIGSFYNEKDGKHWTKFIVVTDAGEMAVRRGWKLSNCYEPTEFGNGGTWNGMKYHKQVLNGVFEHLAIVPDPRYEESIILTPEEFKRYNEDHDLELKRLANSKEKKPMFWTKKKLEIDAKQLKNATVLLPKSKKEVALTKLIADADAAQRKGARVVNAKDIVKLDGEDMTIRELVDAHGEALDEIEDLKAQLKNAKKKNKKDEFCENEDDDEEEIEDDEMENSDDEDEDLENDEDEEEDAKLKKKNRKKNKKKNSMGASRYEEGDDFEDGIIDDEEDDDNVVEFNTRKKNSKTKKKSSKVKNRRQNDDEEFFADDEEEFDDDDDAEEDSPRMTNSQKREKAKKKAKKMRNAADRHAAQGDKDVEYIETSSDRTARGQELYGSPKTKQA